MTMTQTPGGTRIYDYLRIYVLLWRGEVIFVEMILADLYTILMLLVIMSYASICAKVIFQRYFRPLHL